MNQIELVKIVSAITSTPQKKVRVIMDTTLDVIMNEVRQNKSVRIRGFGLFEPFFRKSRKVRNPQTNKIVESKNVTVARFRVGNIFRKVVKNAHEYKDKQ